MYKCSELMLRWMKYLWIVSRQLTEKRFAHRLVLNQKFCSKIVEVPSGCTRFYKLALRVIFLLVQLTDHLGQPVTQLHIASDG